MTAFLLGAEPAKVVNMVDFDKQSVLELEL